MEKPGREKEVRGKKRDGQQRKRERKRWEWKGWENLPLGGYLGLPKYKGLLRGKVKISSEMYEKGVLRLDCSTPILYPLQT